MSVLSVSDFVLQLSKRNILLFLQYNLTIAFINNIKSLSLIRASASCVFRAQASCLFRASASLSLPSVSELVPSRASASLSFLKRQRACPFTSVSELIFSRASASLSLHERQRAYLFSSVSEFVFSDLTF